MLDPIDDISENEKYSIAGGALWDLTSDNKLYNFHHDKIPTIKVFCSNDTQVLDLAGVPCVRQLLNRNLSIETILDKIDRLPEYQRQEIIRQGTNFLKEFALEAVIAVFTATVMYGVGKLYDGVRIFYWNGQHGSAQEYMNRQREAHTENCDKLWQAVTVDESFALSRKGHQIFNGFLDFKEKVETIEQRLRYLKGPQRESALIRYTTVGGIVLAILHYNYKK